jgi:hypothetical protein
MNGFVDHIYVLKLKRNDTEELAGHLAERFPGVPVRWYEVDGIGSSVKNEGRMELSVWSIMRHRHMDEVSKDILRNMIGMIREAHDKGLERVLFLEEDVYFEPFALRPQTVSWLKKDRSWDVFYLGYCSWPWPVAFCKRREVVRVWSPLLCHAYMLHRRGMEKLLAFTADGTKNMDRHIDKMISTLPGMRKYARFPMVAFQKKDPALFVKGCDRLGIRVSLRTVSRLMEYISVVLPVVLVLLLCFFLVRWVFSFV